MKFQVQFLKIFLIFIVKLFYFLVYFFQFGQGSLIDIWTGQASCKTFQDGPDMKDFIQVFIRRVENHSAFMRDDSN